MRRRYFVLSVLVFNLLFGRTNLSSGIQSNAPDPLQAHSGANIEVYVSNAIYSCATGIRFDWHIKNLSPNRIYIYTPFLTGQAADLLEYDNVTQTVLIPSSMKSEASFPPYSYPEPTFRQLTSQETVKGHFHEPISTQLSCNNLRPKRLTFEIAWSTDTTQVLTEISRIKKEGQVHPGNPLVHWGNLAKSNRAPIKYVGRH